MIQSNVNSSQEFCKMAKTNWKVKLKKVKCWNVQVEHELEWGKTMKMLIIMLNLRWYVKGSGVHMRVRHFNDDVCQKIRKWWAREEQVRYIFAW